MGSDRRTASLLVALALIAGCAPFPADLGPRPRLAEPRLGEVIAERGPERSAGESRWWESFGDVGLNRLVDEALSHNPTLAVAAARLAAAGATARQAELDTEFHTSLDAGAQRSRISENGLFPPPLAGEVYNLADVTASVNYNLDWWGKNGALVAAARENAQVAEAERAAARLNVASLVVDGYFALANAIAQESLALQQAEKRKVRLALERSRYERGLISPYAVREAEQSLARSEDALQRCHYEIRSARYRLAAAAGLGPGQAAELPPARLPEPVALPDALPLDWLARRPDVAAQRLRVDAAADMTDAARADFYPNINVMLLAGVDSRSAADLFSRSSATGSYGAAIHLPIFNVRSVQNRLRTREAEYAAAVGDYNRTVIEAARQAADSHAALATLIERSEFQRRAVDAAADAEALSASRFRNGLASRGDTLGAEISVLAQRQSELETRTARLRATVALYQAIGGGWTTEKERQ